MDSKNYIGMDVHQATVSVTIPDAQHRSPQAQAQVPLA